MCFINNYNISPVELPFGGYKMSGELCFGFFKTCRDKNVGDRME